MGDDDVQLALEKLKLLFPEWLCENVYYLMLGRCIINLKVL